MHLSTRSARDASSPTNAALTAITAAPRPASQPGGSRAGLLASCSGMALVATTVVVSLVLFFVPGGGEARAADCTPQEGYACLYILQPPAAPNGQSPASPGSAVGAANVNIPGVAYPAGQAVAILTSGGQGGSGKTDTSVDGTGADGGRGGDGNTLTVTMQPGTSTGEITVLQAGGGAGGISGYSGHGGDQPTSGSGGTAGTIVAGVPGAPMTGQLNNPAAAQAPNNGYSPSVGLYVGASGGAGAQGVGQISGSDDDGGNGGNGGNSSGGVSVVFGGNATGTQGGILAISQGGNGGAGGAPDTADFPLGAQGGTGGNGGTAGPVTMVLTQGSVIGTSGSGAAVTAQSFGGQGAPGGKGGGDASGGNAGTGADGGSVSVTSYGSIQTGNPDSPGILGQSFGGAGGGGGQGGGWGAGGGNGGTGGSGNSIGFVAASVSFTNTGGSNSPGILLQSIGGGGGNGGDSNGWLAVGGDGAGAGNGGQITIYKSTDGNGASPITTTGERSAGIMAQSIGGGGGNGGNAASTAATPINIVVGGSGAGGGTGGPISAALTGSITTSGLHSPGILLQSVGGGGGNGGSAYSHAYSAGVGASVSLGGSGGGGGNGGPIGQIVQNANTGALFSTSTGQITTMGADSYGIIGQSIGGGGGNGGLSAATAKTYSAATDEVPVPTISVAVAIGGSGGNGGSASSVYLQNTGLITTAGSGASGFAGQSIGGGGGTGGDSSASASAKGGNDSPVNIAAAIGLGGLGGSGGAGGAVSLVNNGLIFTRGESADAILVQSIGGGGGIGGSGDAQARSSGDGTNIATTLTLGGTGGSGGNGSPVSVSNTGALLTLGDGATGILAQSVGGGGGRGGGAAGTSNGQFAVSVSLGGGGGVGGSTWQGPNTNAVVVMNSGSIVTYGADAPAIVAQSIAGGGGMGGKSASTLGNHTNTGDGGNGASGSVTTATSSLTTALAAGTLGQLNSLSGLIGVAGQALGTRTTGGGGDALNALGSAGGDSGDGSASTSLHVHVNLGGTGNSGGDAGHVQVTNTNTGSIGTVGVMSDGILAQAIGGGGGGGGAAISSVTSSSVNSSAGDINLDRIRGALSLGGTGGAGGNGANVTVENDGSIITIGPMSSGIVAQSIAGGGGIAGASAAKVQGSNGAGTSVLSLPIAIGASNGGGGASGTVTVTNTGTIETRSHDAIGILAQSITGGGGLVRTRSSDAADNNGGGAVATGGSYAINLTFGPPAGQPGSQPSDAGTVTVNHTGSISTSGADAYGILAQSIGGGGGLVQGGTPNSSSHLINGSGPGAGGSTVTVNVGNPTTGATGSTSTSGRGAIAVFAQSIGGGGGIAGDTGLTAQRASFSGQGQGTGGNGGNVTVNVSFGSLLSTRGDNTPVVLAQSVGGGGGRITASGYGAYDGSAGGVGIGGDVQVNVAGTVQASGTASPGIFAEVANGTLPSGVIGGVVAVTVGTGATVQGGHNFSARDGYGSGIYIVGGGTSPTSTYSNSITNQGTITSLDNINGTAIYSTGGWTTVTNLAGGTIIGSLNLDNGGGGGTCTGASCPSVGGTLTNQVGGTLNTGAAVRLGVAGLLTNSGTLSIGGAGRIAATAVTGNLVQTGSGRLVVDTDHRTGEADRLDVQGTVRLGGVVEVHPANISNRAVTILTATGGVTIDPGLAATRTYLVRYDVQGTGSNVQVQPQGEFAAAASGFGTNQQAIATHLQQVFDTGSELGGGFGALAGIGSAQDYRAALSSLAGASVGGIAATRQVASERFNSNLINCEPYRGGDTPLREESCAWLRTEGTRVNLAGSSDSPGYRQDAVTYQIGGQKEVAPGWFFGASAGYETSWLRSDDDGSKVSGQSALFGLMLKRQSGPWTFSGVLDGGHGWYQSKRQITAGGTSGQANGSPEVSHAGLHGRVTYQVGLGNDWYMRPGLSASTVYRGISGYTEAGSTPFNLAVRGSSDVVGSASPMLEAGRGGMVAGLGTLRGFVGLGAAFYVNNDWKGRAGFQLASAGSAGSSFTTTSHQPAAVAKLQAGLDLFTVRGVEAKVTYDAALAPGYVAQSLIGRLAYSF